jgi:hypothetical protein
MGRRVLQVKFVHKGRGDRFRDRDFGLASGGTVAYLGRVLVVKRFLAALTCCGLLSLAACSDDSSSSADPPSPTPTASSSSTEPSPTPDAETPEEFVRRWVDADTHMQNTGDGDDYRDMSAKCPNCLDYADYIEGIWEAGGYVKTDGWLIGRSRTSKPLDNGEVEVTIDVTSTPAEFVEKAGGPVQHYERHDLTYIVALRPSNRDWSVTNFSEVAQ